MNINVYVNDETVREAARLVMRHYADQAFLEKIAAVPRFNHTRLTSGAVARTLEIEMSLMDIEIIPYQTRWPWSKVIGYAEGNKIYINIRKLDLPVQDRVNNIFHEACHLAGFTHRGNWVDAYNLKTVPYLAGSIFAKYVNELR